MVSKGAFVNVVGDFQQQVIDYHVIPQSIKNSTKSSIMKPFVAVETPIKPPRDSFGPPVKIIPTDQKKSVTKAAKPSKSKSGEKRSGSKKKTEKKKNAKPVQQLLSPLLSNRSNSQKAAKPPKKQKAQSARKQSSQPKVATTLLKPRQNSMTQLLLQQALARGILNPEGQLQNSPRFASLKH